MFIDLLFVAAVGEFWPHRLLSSPPGLVFAGRGIAPEFDGNDGWMGVALLTVALPIGLV
jgi:hypothetical protein